MKVLALNIRHGGGARIAPIADYLCASRADVIVLSEFRDHDKTGRLRMRLHEDGVSFFAGTSAPRGMNSVCIFSRRPFAARLYPELGAENAHCVLSAGFLGLTVHGVYFPQKQAKSALFELLLRGPPSCDAAALIVGDFNTGCHRIDETGATFHCSRQFEALSDGPFADSWRSRNPGIREFSWYSSAGNGFRIDHAFATEDIDKRISHIYYDHEPRISAITDHAAIVVELDG